MLLINLKENISKAAFEYIERNFSISDYQMKGLFLMSLNLGKFLIISENGTFEQKLYENDKSGI